MSNEIKQEFILQSMEEYLQQLQGALPASIRKKKIGQTQDLINSIRTEAAKNGQGATGKLYFNESGRMVDMGVGRKYPLGGIKLVTERLLSSNKFGFTTSNKTMRKPKKWYSPVVYAKLDWLINKLLYGFSEEAIKSIKQMQNSNAV